MKPMGGGAASAADFYASQTRQSGAPAERLSLEPTHATTGKRQMQVASAPNSIARVRCIFELLQSPNPAVSYEASSTLVALSASPTAVRAAALCFCKLLAENSQNNVKLIVLERLAALRTRHLRAS